MAHHIYSHSPTGEGKRIAGLGVHSLVFHSFTFDGGRWLVGQRDFGDVFKQFRTMRLSGNISAWRWLAVRGGGVEPHD